MGLAHLIARQLGRPSRLTGRILNLANARINEQALGLLEVAPENHALDVGFGGAVALEKLAGRAAFVAGIDHSKPAVRAASNRFRDEIASGRMQVEHAGVDAIPFANASFDRVLTVNTIYFWPDPEHALREILRVLKPGARLVIGTNAKHVPQPIAQHGFTFHTDKEQESILRSVGFSDVHFDRRDRSLFALAAKPRRAA